jgi:hypothetical protein
VLTLAIIAEAHLCLPKANCVFPRAHAIELLELGLLHILRLCTVSEVGGKGCGVCARVPRGSVNTHLAGEVDLDGLDADVLRTGGHGGRAIGFLRVEDRV